MKVFLRKALRCVIVFCVLLSLFARIPLIGDAQDEFSFSALATVVPQSGTAKNVQIGDLIFSDRTTHRFAETVPSRLVGASYVMDSLENGTSATVTQSGWLYVLTPAVGTPNSQVVALQQKGYAPIAELDGGVLATTISEQLILLAKQVEVGETISFGKWAILFAKTDASYVSPLDVALTPPTVLQNPTAAEYQDGNREWQGMPGLARDGKSGRLWATWYSGGTGEGSDNWVVLYTSADDGNSWTGPVVVVDHVHPVRVYDPNLWVDPNGRMWLIWAQSNTYFDGRCGTWMIYTDNPESQTPTWSEPVRVANGIAINDPTVLSNGDWLLPTAIWEKGFVVAGLEKEVNANVYVSHDQGESWSYLSSVPAYQGERDCDENMIVELSDGSLRMLIRTKLGIEESYSYDGGASWTAAKDAQLTRVVSKFQIKRLSSGNLLLIYNAPPDGSATRSHLTAALSTDGGKTWPYRLLLDERYRASYPDVQEAEDGRLYIIYDCLRTKNGNLLLSVITEQDLMAGRLVSDGSVLARLVNDNTVLPVPPGTEEITTSPSPDESETVIETGGITDPTTDTALEQEETLSRTDPADQTNVSSRPWLICGVIVAVAVVVTILYIRKRSCKTDREI